MVKGISKQVIVVHNPDKGLFEQAIFILKDGAVERGITEEMLLKEAKGAIRSGKGKSIWHHGPIWACCGATVTGIAWLLTAIW